MSQTADTQPHSVESILQILRNQAIAIPNSSTSSRYLRALDSLTSSLSLDLSSKNLDPSLLTLDSLQRSCTDWLISQWLMHTPFSTASLYLDIISSLYGSAAKAGLLPPTKLFSQLKADLKTLGPEGWRQGIDDEIFARALRLTKNASHLIADDATAAAMVIYSLTHTLTPLSEIALLKKSDCLVGTHGSCVRPESRAEASLSLGALDSWFLTLNPSKRSQYVFPLRQSSRTPKQLQAHVAKIVNDLFRRARLPQATDPFQTVEALWAYAALRAGIPASTLLAHLGHVPLGLPILKLSRMVGTHGSCVRPESRAEASLSSGALDPYKEDFANIGKIFLENPPRWYAMSLRPGVRFTQLQHRLHLVLDSWSLTLKSTPDIQLFYPSEEITRAIGKKIVVRQRPFIHSVVFFRAKLTDIGRLFARIGDLAWCYRQSARPGAPYAEITDSQFHLFQQTIARFTPDYEVAPSGELELRPNDRVRIVGGLFTGHEATVQESKPSALPETGSLKPETSTIYRLSIIGDNGIDWRITVDPRLLKPQSQPE